jgi:ParB family transcriptional regulator, chromosome partitioning protein
MSKPRGLGRGLEAFFPGRSSATGSTRQADRVALITVGAIEPNRFQPRRLFDEAELSSLAQSIRANGVLSPILVRAVDAGAGRYEILAGERRWRAAKLAGLEAIPALVRDARDAEALELALLENLQRTDLNAIEEASGYRQLMEDHGFTQESLSARLGKARPTVANALRLLALPDSVQALVRDGRLSAGHARALAALPASKAEAIARRAAAKGMSVREVERLAGRSSHARKRANGATRGRTALGADLEDVESRLRFALATRVTIKPAGKGGAIEIRYAGDEELQRIVDTICPEDR